MYQVAFEASTYNRNEIEVETLMTVAAAEGRVLRFAYEDAKNKITTREVQPTSLERSNNGLFIRAYDFDRQAPRTFTVADMSDVKLGRAVPAEDNRVVARVEVEAHLLHLFDLNVIGWDNEVEEVAKDIYNIKFTGPNGGVVRITGAVVEDGKLDVDSLLDEIEL